VNIVWFSWKDISHPQAGGAEVVSDQLRKRLVKDGHTVVLITAMYPGSLNDETVNGVRVMRGGGRFSVYLKARSLFRHSSLANPDMIIDEMNTIPFMATLYAKSARKVLLTYQLARKVWFYQMVFPISIIGYLLEPLYLRFISKRYDSVMTESESTRKDLARYGFDSNKVKLFRVGIDLEPVVPLPIKSTNSTVIFLGALRPMKRPIDVLKAFEIARDDKPELELVMAGSDTGAYAKKIKNYAQKSRHSKSIKVLGRVSTSDKLLLLREASMIIVTSVKEGWGLIVTEANSQGTPAIAYDIDGLRDSVVDGETGIIVASGDTESLAKSINNITRSDSTYDKIRKNAYEHSKQFTFDNSYTDFVEALNIKPVK